MGHKKKILLQNIDTNIEIDHIQSSRKKILERERELKLKQLYNIDPSEKLRSSDLHRIVKFTDNSIFDPVKCCIWKGYITNLTNKKKGTYINFYFKNKKKVALHRLLYCNFKGHIKKKDYIKFTCSNNGKCCNVNHMIHFENNCNGENATNKNEKINEKIIEEYDDETFKIRIY